MRRVELKPIKSLLLSYRKQSRGELLCLAHQSVGLSGIRVVAHPKVPNSIAYIARADPKRHVAVEIKDGELASVVQPKRFRRPLAVVEYAGKDEDNSEE